MDTFLLKNLRVAAVNVDVTDCADTTYSGYVRADCEIRDSVLARTLLIGSDDGEALWISLDETNLPTHPTCEFKRRLAECTGIPVSRIVLFQTHAHSALKAAVIKWDLLLERIAAALPALRQASRPMATMSQRVGLLPTGSIFNRRISLGADIGDTCVVFNTHCQVDLARGTIDAGGWVLNEQKKFGAADENTVILAGQYCLSNHVDSRLHLWILRDAAGKPLTAILRANTHAVIVSQKWVKNVISGDYPAIATRVVEQALGVPCLFINGAFGDTRPLHSEYSFAERDRFGKLCAQTALAAAETTVPAAQLSGASLDVALPLRADVGRSIEEARKLLEECRSSQPQTPGERKRREERLVLLELAVSNNPTFLLEQDLQSGQIPVEFQAWRWGNMSLITLPGEPFVSVAEALERSTGCVVAGLASSSTGYLPDLESFDRGGYEPTWCCFDKTGLAMIPKHVADVARRTI